MTRRHYACAWVPYGVAQDQQGRPIREVVYATDRTLVDEWVANSPTGYRSERGYRERLRRSELTYRERLGVDAGGWAACDDGRAEMVLPLDRCSICAAPITDYDNHWHGDRR